MDEETEGIISYNIQVCRMCNITFLWVVLLLFVVVVLGEGVSQRSHG